MLFFLLFKGLFCSETNSDKECLLDLEDDDSAEYCLFVNQKSPFSDTGTDQVRLVLLTSDDDLDIDVQGSGRNTKKHGFHRLPLPHKNFSNKTARILQDTAQNTSLYIEKCTAVVKRPEVMFCFAIFLCILAIIIVFSFYLYFFVSNYFK